MEEGESQERHTFSVIATLSGLIEHCLWSQSLHFRGGGSHLCYSNYHCPFAFAFAAGWNRPSKWVPEEPLCMYHNMKIH